MKKSGLSALIISALALSISVPVKAESGLHTLVYEVYAGGIHAVQAELDLDFTKADRYSLVLSAHTRGFLGKLAPWSGTFETHGWNNPDGTLQPELHKSTATWRDEKEVKEYNYNRDGSFDSLVITDHEKLPENTDISDELTQGTIDVLTATLEVMEAVAAGKECKGTSEVFDGKRRFEMVYASEESEKLTSTKYNVYGGQTELCTVEVKPIAGKWYDKPRGWLSIQEQGREHGTMPTVWMGKVTENGPAVPVKVLVKTAYGALFMHLAEYKSENEFLVAQKRVETE